MTAPSESPERFAEWNNAKPGDTVTLKNPDAAVGPCDATHPGSTLFCTRDKNHQGQHVATGLGEVLEVWPS